MITLLLKLKRQKVKKIKRTCSKEQSVVAVANRVSSCLLVFLEPGSVHIQVTFIIIVQLSFYLFLFFYLSNRGTSSILNYSLFQLSTFKKRNGRSMCTPKYVLTSSNVILNRLNKENRFHPEPIKDMLQIYQHHNLFDCLLHP